MSIVTLTEAVQRMTAAEAESMRLKAYKALASKLRGSIGYAYISERAVFEFISGYDALTKENEAWLTTDAAE